MLHAPATTGWGFRGLFVLQGFLGAACCRLCLGTPAGPAAVAGRQQQLLQTPLLQPPCRCTWQTSESIACCHIAALRDLQKPTAFWVTTALAVFCHGGDI